MIHAGIPFPGREASFTTRPWSIDDAIRKRFRRRGQHCRLTARDDDVADAKSADALHVQARLEREDLVLLDAARIDRHVFRILVRRDTDAVAGAMNEVVIV